MEKKEIRKQWKKIDKKILDTDLRKLERESLYNANPDYKWLVKRASKDAWEEIVSNTKEYSQEREYAVNEFVYIYSNSKKAKKIIEKREFNEIKEMPKGVEKRRKMRDFYRRHPKKAMLKIAGTTLLVLGSVAVISVSVFQATTYFKGNSVTVDKVPGAEINEDSIGSGSSSIIEGPVYIQQPQEPIYTEQESQIKEENQGHEFVGAEDDMGNFVEEESEAENILEK